MPSLNELAREMAFPSGVFGPVLFFAFWRLASILAGLWVMEAAPAIKPNKAYHVRWRVSPKEAGPMSESGKPHTERSDRMDRAGSGARSRAPLCRDDNRVECRPR